MAELTRANVFEPRYGWRWIKSCALALLERCQKKVGLDNVPLPVPIVDRHSSNLMPKADIHDRVDLARFAIREGLVDA